MKSFLQTLVAALAGGAVAFGVVTNVAPGPAMPAASGHESVYDRVLRTGVLRCGYGIYAPYLTKDPSSGKMSGIWYDFTEAVADHLGLKVNWAEEVGLGDIATALEAGRIDAYCGGLWTAGKRVRVVDFLEASAYEPLLAFVRTDDHRFDHDLSTLNSPDVRISTIDGEGGGLVAAEDFPQAKPISLPQLSNYADMFNQVVTNKADVTFAAPSGAAVFMQNNPGALRPILGKAIRIFPVALAIKYGEGKLRDMLNQAQRDILYNGLMDRFIRKYEVNKGDFWPVEKPYEVPQ